ncbi:MAG: ester cyclase [Calditrichia bacterium]
MKTFYRYALYLILPVLLLMPGCMQKRVPPDMNLKLDKYVAFWNTGNFEGIEQVLHPDFELRMTPNFEPEKGIDTFRETVTKWRNAYPDFNITIGELLYDREKVAVRWTITATNNGPGWHPPTGRQVKVPGMSIIHFREEKIVDEWIAGNNGYWLHQLGFALVSPFEKEQ